MPQTSINMRTAARMKSGGHDCLAEGLWPSETVGRGAHPARAVVLLGILCLKTGLDAAVAGQEGTSAVYRGCPGRALARKLSCSYRVSAAELTSAAHVSMPLGVSTAEILQDFVCVLLLMVLLILQDGRLPIPSLRISICESGGGSSLLT